MIPFTKIVLNEIIFMYCDLINTLKNFLKIFECISLTCIQGMSVSVITNHLHAPVVSLDEIGALPDETCGYILCDLT